jgi:hypothetical protein
LETPNGKAQKLARRIAQTPFKEKAKSAKTRVVERR